MGGKKKDKSTKKKRSTRSTTDGDGSGGDSEGEEGSTRSSTSKKKKNLDPLSLEMTLKRKQDNDTIPWLTNNITWKEYDQRMLIYARTQFYKDIIDRKVNPEEEYTGDKWKAYKIRSDRMFAAFTLTMQESTVGRNLIDKHSDEGDARGLYFELERHFTTNLIGNNRKKELSRLIREPIRDWKDSHREFITRFEKLYCELANIVEAYNNDEIRRIELSAVLQDRPEYEAILNSEQVLSYTKNGFNGGKDTLD